MAVESAPGIAHPNRPALSVARFDRAAHRREDEAWLEQAWSDARVILISPESTTPVGPVGEQLRVQLRDPAAVDPSAPRWFLGIANNVPYFAVPHDAGEDTWRSVRHIGPGGDPLELDLLVTSIALRQWHSRHEHCPRCGAVTVITRTGWARQCPVDGSTHFPRTDPAVIMLVHDGGDRCLLGRGPSWPAGRFSTLAGFVEPGESLEAAVAREVHEEVGVRVTDVRYVDSQPWPFPASLMLGFNALAVGDLAITLDQDEMAAAGWFTRDEVQRAAAWTDLNALEGWSATEDRPAGSSEDADRTLSAISPRLSISRYLIDEWLAGRMP